MVKKELRRDGSDLRRDINQFKLGIVEGIAKLTKYDVITTEDAIQMISIITNGPLPQPKKEIQETEEYEEVEEQ